MLSYHRLRERDLKTYLPRTPPVPKSYLRFSALALSTGLATLYPMDFRWFAAGVFGALPLLSFGEEKIDFNRDVRPILSDNCFHCHGPDSKNQKSKFRLDTEENLFSEKYSAVVRGELKESELHWRIHSEDDDEVMPPADSNRSLSQKEKETLDKWIEQGAPYAKHWAFTVPQKPAVPGAGKEWAKSEIDRFVAAKLTNENLKPAPEASPETLLRRASLALTGLQPTPEEIAEFRAAAASDPGKAYEAAVDRYLASIHFAERLTLRWLDAARYADTDGYQVDSPRTNWPWRDWVIHSFHENKPFDQFSIEQIAGDMLPNATDQQRLASAFNRNHRQNAEGGALAEEFLVENVIDRVETTSTVWLGLTMGCARCHDHKYDPLSQREFFQMYAYFNNIGERGTGKGVSANPLLKIGSPIVEAPKELLTAVEKAEAHMAAVKKTSPARFEAWLAETEKTLAEDAKDIWQTAELSSVQVYGEAKLEGQGDGSWKLTGPKLAKGVYNLQFPVRKGETITALSLEALSDPSFTAPRKLARSTNGNFVLTDFKVLVANNDKLEQAEIRSASATHSQEGFPIANAIDAKKNTGWAIFGKDKKGPSNETAFFVFSKPIQPKEDTTVHVQLRHESGFASHNIGRLRLATTSDPNPELRTGAGLDEAITEALQTPADQRNKDQNAALKKHYDAIDPEMAAAKASLDQANQQLAATGVGPVNVMVMNEREGDPLPAYLLNRGSYLEPDKSEALPRAVPAALFSGETQPKDRLEFAQWMASGDNPLTARVYVNRVWQDLLGVGLVKTTEDFGLQGEVPLYAELLDWLAVHFVESGWDVKELHRLILTSAMFRQHSRVAEEMTTRDPENRLLARGPRYRMDGFAIRDMALRSSGLLSEAPGGPPVKPYQPAGLWNAVSSNSGTKYASDKGEKLYRKSMYTYWKRAVNPPRQIIFDAAGREACNVRARRTNTPLQALALMNDVTFVESARNTAERILKAEAKDDATRLAKAYEIVTSREMRASQAKILSENLDFFRRHYEANEAAAKEFLSAGESPRDESLPVSEYAAWAAVTHLMLNLDESITLE